LAAVYDADVHLSTDTCRLPQGSQVSKNVFCFVAHSTARITVVDGTLGVYDILVLEKANTERSLLKSIISRILKFFGHVIYGNQEFVWRKKSLKVACYTGTSVRG